MAFQERMSNSAYQRSMDDMRKAGLNPILTYKTGPASTPGGSSFTAQNTVTSGLAAAQAAAQTTNLREQNNNLQVNSAYQKQQTDLAAQSTRRTQLENEAYASFSPRERALALSGSTGGLYANAISSAKNLLGKIKEGGGLLNYKFPNPLNFLKGN